MNHDDQLNNPYAYFEDTLDFQGSTGVSEFGDLDDFEPRTPFEIRCLWKKWPLTRPARVIVTKDELTVEAKGLTEPVVIPRNQAAKMLKVKRDCLKFSEFYHPLRKILFNKRISGKSKEKQLLNIIRLTVWQESEGTPEEMYQRVYERIKKWTIQTSGIFLATIPVLSLIYSTLLDWGNFYDFLMILFHFLVTVASCFLIWGRNTGSKKIPVLVMIFALVTIPVFLFLPLESSYPMIASVYMVGAIAATFIEFLLLPKKIKRLENRFQLENDIDNSQH